MLILRSTRSQKNATALSWNHHSVDFLVASSLQRAFQHSLDVDDGDAAPCGLLRTLQGRASWDKCCATTDDLRTLQMADALTSGTGEFDRLRFLEELPQKLGIKERKVKSVLDGLAKDRKRSTLVQSVSYLRQKNAEEVVKSLNNLLACHKVHPENLSQAPSSTHLAITRVVGLMWRNF